MGKRWKNDGKGEISLYFGAKISFLKRGGGQNILFSANIYPLAKDEQTHLKNVERLRLGSIKFPCVPGPNLEFHKDYSSQGPSQDRNSFHF